MSSRLFVKVGSEEPRGPLGEADVRASFASGVLPPSTLVGTSPDTLRPIAEVLAELAVGNAKKQSKIARTLLLVLGIGVPMIGVAIGATLYVKNRPAPLCPATPHILAKLQDHLKIKVYASLNIPKVAAEEKKVEVVLRQMQDVSNGLLDIEVIDLNPRLPDAEEKMKAAKEAGLQATIFDDPKNPAASSVNGYFGMVFEYRTEKDKLSLLSSADGIEFWVDNKIREISAKADGLKKRIGIVTGHKGVSINDAYLVPNQTGAASSPTLHNIITQYFPFYQIVDVDLKKPIESNLDGLLVLSPDEDFADPELHALDDFAIKQSKPLAIIASSALIAVSDPQMKVTLSTHNLDKLTKGYGLEINRDLVLETKSRFTVRVDTMGGAKNLDFDFIPRAREEDKTLDAASPVFFRIPDVYFPLSSSITRHDDRQPGAKLKVLAHAQNAIRDTRDQIELDPLNSSKRSKPSGGDQTPSDVLLAASVEGKLSSAFDPNAKSSTADARVLVIASSLFFQNPFVRAGAPPPGTNTMAMMAPGGDEALNSVAMPYTQQFGTTGILVFKGLLDWLTFEENMSTCLTLKPSEEPTKK